MMMSDAIKSGYTSLYFFCTQGVKLHYVESGERDSPLLLLLHGFPDCWLSWRYQIPVLAQHYR
jgi:pimeloyl-ACP methyl ester carboxylesterase